jgi:hypothetical protein
MKPILPLRGDPCGVPVVETLAGGTSRRRLPKHYQWWIGPFRPRRVVTGTPQVIEGENDEIQCQWYEVEPWSEAALQCVGGRMSRTVADIVGRSPSSEANAAGMLRCPWRARARRPPLRRRAPGYSFSFRITSASDQTPR